MKVKKEIAEVEEIQEKKELKKEEKKEEKKIEENLVATKND